MMETAKNSLYISRRFNCSVNTLFKWIVEPDLICQWFGPKSMTLVEVKNDLTIGGAYTIELLKPNGMAFSIEGEYIEIDEPNKVVFTFTYKGIPNTPPASIVEITIERVDTNISNLSLIQKFDIVPTDMPSRSSAWQNMFAKLKEKIFLAIKS